MKTFKTIGVIGALALAALSPAASAADSMRVHVPFAFVVAGQRFAAGDYVIKQSENGIVLVQGSHKGAMVLSTPGSRPANANVGLQFTNSGQYLHLVAVEEGGAETRAIPVRAVEERGVTLSSSK